MAQEEDAPLVSSTSYPVHHGNERAYIRDMMLGINDGLISTFLLTIGIYASGVLAADIRLSILSGSLAGSLSMGLGEYIATQSQNEMTEAELELEKLHIEFHLHEELRQVKDFLQTTLRIHDDLLVARFLGHMQTDKEGLFAFMKTVEFGVNEEDHRHPWIAMLVSGCLFFMGSIPSLCSFLVPLSLDLCISLCCLLNLCTLFGVGALKSKMTNTVWYISGGENLAMGITAGLISYGIGYCFSLWMKASSLLNPL